MTYVWPDNVRIRPIQQWPGEPRRGRKDSPFGAPWERTLALLDLELRQLRARNVVLQLAITDRDIRRDGYPRTDAKPSHPGVILSMDTPHGPLSYPCDTYWSWQDNLRGIALALQALRTVDRYGVTKRGEQYTGWKQLPSGTPLSPAMTVDEAAAFMAEATGAAVVVSIGDLVDAGGRVDQQEVEHRYRLAARRLHPDTGGSTEQFQKLQDAKRVLDGAR